MSTVTLDQAWAMAFNAFQEGRLEEAESVCRQIVAAEPRCADAWNCLGLVAMRVNAYPRAAEWFTRAMNAVPGNAAYPSNLSAAYQGLGRHTEAVAAARQAVTLAPDFVDALANLGRALDRSGQYGEAATVLARATALDASHFNAWINCGSVLSRVGDHAGAEAKYRHALTLAPQNAMVWAGLAGVLHLRGDDDGARAAFQRALALDPANAQAHWSLAVIHLLHDDYPAGWEEFEWRWKCEDTRPHPLNLWPAQRPLWGGEDIAGKTILIFGEQGFGDMFQFLRYVPMVMARRARVIIATGPELRRILEDFPGVGVWPVAAGPWPDCDVYCPLLTLARIFRTTLDTIPATVPYLAADPALAARWRGVLEPGRHNIGLAWAGRPSHLEDAARTLALSAFAPLAGVDGITFHSLQKGDAARQAGAPPEGLRLLDHAAALEDFRDTAALLVNLDGLITVDTAVVHLAGALGKPVWVMVPFRPDWRWGLAREYSPWYPTMRLFRQTQGEDWQPVIRRMADELSRGGM